MKKMICLLLCGFVPTVYAAQKGDFLYGIDYAPYSLTQKITNWKFELGDDNYSRNSDSEENYDSFGLDVAYMFTNHLAISIATNLIDNETEVKTTTKINGVKSTEKETTKYTRRGTGIGLTYYHYPNKKGTPYVRYITGSGFGSTFITTKNGSVEEKQSFDYEDSNGDNSYSAATLGYAYAINEVFLVRMLFTRSYYNISLEGDYEYENTATNTKNKEYDLDMRSTTKHDIFSIGITIMSSTKYK